MDPAKSSRNAANLITAEAGENRINRLDNSTELTETMPTPGVYVTPFGAASLAVAYGSFSGPLHVLVVKRQHCSLLGRN
ncbi:hypothetical protein T4D_11085 [Trichinella pseudospiralis]|uniref:Uncharacterized protein n=1 Tax=Trichinella pseudospiralis TaxID=6337 RepID=A0A0V1G2H1_TRIPS|nr:hypothetical protein T4D_11085 [Trichinella pseudospiralis]